MFPCPRPSHVFFLGALISVCSALAARLRPNHRGFPSARLPSPPPRAPPADMPPFPRNDGPRHRRTRRLRNSTRSPTPQRRRTERFAPSPPTKPTDFRPPPAPPASPPPFNALAHASGFRYDAPPHWRRCGRHPPTTPQASELAFRSRPSPNSAQRHPSRSSRIPIGTLPTPPLLASTATIAHGGRGTTIAILDAVSPPDASLAPVA